MTPMRRMPEFRQLDSAKSTMRNLPPKYTAGFARRSVRYLRRLPRPPASTSATARFGRSRLRASSVFGIGAPSLSLSPSDDSARCGKGPQDDALTPPPAAMTLAPRRASFENDIAPHERQRT